MRRASTYVLGFPTVAFPPFSFPDETVDGFYVDYTLELEVRDVPEPGTLALLLLGGAPLVLAIATRSGRS